MPKSTNPIDKRYFVKRMSETTGIRFSERTLSFLSDIEASTYFITSASSEARIYERTLSLGISKAFPGAILKSFRTESLLLSPTRMTIFVTFDFQHSQRKLLFP